MVTEVQGKTFKVKASGQGGLCVCVCFLSECLFVWTCCESSLKHRNDDMMFLCFSSKVFGETWVLCKSESSRLMPLVIQLV